MHEEPTPRQGTDPMLTSDPFPPQAPAGRRTLTKPMIAALVVLALLVVGVMVMAVLAVVKVRDSGGLLPASASSARVLPVPTSLPPETLERDWANPAWLGTFAGDTDTGRYHLTFTDDDPVTGVLIITSRNSACRMEVRQGHRFNEASVAARITPLADGECGPSRADLVVSGDNLTMVYRATTYVLNRV